jgi:hypothetical protein
MNERIKELAEQAGFEPHYEPDGTFSYSEQFEKFAELIIKANIDACETIAYQASIIESGEMARKTSATAKSCANLIKLQFGVK